MHFTEEGKTLPYIVADSPWDPSEEEVYKKIEEER